MSTSYLSLTRNVTLDGFGQGVISVRPDIGQYWLPTLVHVSTRSGNSANVTLFAGGPTNSVDSTFIRDFTNTGQNDSSTILSGTIVSPGEAITVQFSGLAADTGILTIAGLSSDVPPTMGIIPSQPGIRFLGGANAYDSLLIDHDSANIAGNGTKGYGPFLAGSAKTVLLSLNNQGLGRVGITLNWGYTNGVFGSEWVDSVVLGPQSLFLNGFPVKAPFFTISITAITLASTFITTIGLSNESVLTPDSGLLTPTVLNAFASQNINAGATRTDLMPETVYGDVDWMVFSSAATWQANLETVDQFGTVVIIDIMNQTMNPARRRVMVPPIQLRTRITNTAGVVNAFTSTVIGRDIPI